MTLVATHRQVVHRLLPQKRSGWRRLERTLEDQRLLCNGALEERINCHRKTGKSLTCGIGASARREALASATSRIREINASAT